MCWVSLGAAAKSVLLLAPAPSFNMHSDEGGVKEKLQASAAWVASGRALDAAQKHFLVAFACIAS